MRLPDLKFTALSDGDTLVESQYLSEGVDPLYSTRERGRITEGGGSFVTIKHMHGVNAIGLPEMEQIVAKMKELN